MDHSGSFWFSSGVRRSLTMPRPPLRLLCLWLCSEAVAAHLRWHETKTLSPHYESATADRNAQSRAWRTLSGANSGGPQASWMEAVKLRETEQQPRAVRKTDAQHRAQRLQQVPREEALRTEEKRVRVPQRGDCSPGEVLQQTRHGPACSPGGTGHHRRRRRSASRDRKRRSEPLEDVDLPFRLNTSGLEEEDYTLPAFTDTTPLAPLIPRTRQRQLRNPFYPLTAEACGAYAVLITGVLIFTAGILGNLSLMCIVCHNYYMRSISNSLLANLALWDFIVIFFCLPLVLFHALTNKWLLGEFTCRIIPYLEVVSLGVTTFTLCALCIDRFRAASNVQMYYEMIENWASTTAKLAVIWVGALLLALPELLIRQLVMEDGEPPDVTPCERCVVRISTELPDTLYVLGLTYDGARLWWYFGCYFCLPTLFTICSSLVTARKIRRAERACVRGGKKQIQLESQMNCAVVALAILYGFCTIPENICNIVSAYMAAGVPTRTLDILQLVSQLLLFCKSAAAPVLLFCLCQPFSRAFLDCCCCCCDECGPPRSNDATAASDTDNEGVTTELELSPFSTIHREASTSYAVVGTHC